MKLEDETAGGRGRIITRSHISLYKRARQNNNIIVENFFLYFLFDSDRRDDHTRVLFFCPVCPGRLFPVSEFYSIGHYHLVVFLISGNTANKRTQQRGGGFFVQLFINVNNIFFGPAKTLDTIFIRNYGNISGKKKKKKTIERNVAIYLYMYAFKVHIFMKNRKNRVYHLFADLFDSAHEQYPTLLFFYFFNSGHLDLLSILLRSSVRPGYVATDVLHSCRCLGRIIRSDTSWDPRKSLVDEYNISAEDCEVAVNRLFTNCKYTIPIQYDLMGATI